MPSKVRRVGVLTSGGDCPGLNAVIRAITKTLEPQGVEVYGILEGFTGLIEDRYIRLDDATTSGLLTVGGTILKTSRNKPHKWPMPDGTTKDMTSEAVRHYQKLGLDCLICLGGGGTQKNAHRLMREGGINVITAPKTIDNDVWGTDICFGFDTGMSIATEALDRLHTTASSHHRVMVVDIMGHNSGWLALGSGIAGGADVILIPEIPYTMEIVAESLLARMQRGKRFSIVAMAEGAMTQDQARRQEDLNKKKKKGKLAEEHAKEPVGAILAEHLEDAIGLETRVTSLGYLQRGGIPTPTDRLLCTKYGTRAAELALQGIFGVMVAKRGQEYIPVSLEDVVGKKRLVPLDHQWVRTAREVGTCMGDEVHKGW
ncbi:MAG: 6-phosphofructokinase [Candidatus Hydrogenedentes bacterium]|nr:6-phosphofructokinase [Candidatus Hydrogenedentota bacterium]